MALDPSYLSMTIDDLQTAFVSLAQQYAQISDTRNDLQALIQRRQAEASAAAKIEDMTPIEQDALRAVLMPDYVAVQAQLKPLSKSLTG